MRGVAYHPRQRVLLAARPEYRLAAGSRPRNGDERRSLALWTVREPTSHWGLCLVFRPIFVTKTKIVQFYIPKTRTNGGTQNENEIKIKIAAMRTNENENDSGQKTHSVIKNFRSHQQLHGPVTIACFGHTVDFGHTVNYSRLADVGGLQN